MMNRKQVRQLAADLALEVTYTKYGVPSTINGQPVLTRPWLTLEAQVKQLLSETQAPQVEVPSATPVEVAQPVEVVAESEEILEEQGEVVEECPATPTQISQVDLNHVTDTQEAPTQIPAPALNHVTPVKPKHPLRGYTLSTKEKVCQALRTLKRVSVERVQDVKVMARLLAKHFGAEVRIRMVDGVQWVLVSKGASRRAFQF